VPRRNGHRKRTWDREPTSAGDQLGDTVLAALLMRQDAEQVQGAGVIRVTFQDAAIERVGLGEIPSRRSGTAAGRISATCSIAMGTYADRTGESRHSRKPIRLPLGQSDPAPHRPDVPDSWEAAPRLLGISAGPHPLAESGNRDQPRIGFQYFGIPARMTE
jgi:hypothetical protein